MSRKGVDQTDKSGNLPLQSKLHFCTPSASRIATGPIDAPRVDEFAAMRIGMEVPVTDPTCWMGSGTLLTK